MLPLRRFLPVLLTAALLPACTNALHEARSEELLALVQEKELEHFIATFALEAPARAVQWAEQQVDAPAWDTAIAQLAEEAGWDALRRELLLGLHEGQTRQLVRSGRLTDAGQEVLDLVRSAPQEHAMDVSGWGLPLIDARLAVLGRHEQVQALHDALRLGPDDEAILLAWLRQRIGADGTAPTHPYLAELLIQEDDANPLPRFAQAAHGLATKLAESAVAAPELELLLVDAWLRMATEMRLANFHFIPRDVRAEREWNINDAGQRDAILTALLQETARTARRDGFRRTMASLEPPSEQYAGLRRSFARYMAYVERGGWDELDVAPNRLTLGARGDDVLQLRQRLHAEDFLGDDDLDNPEFDAPLRRAVLHYQHTHQLTESGTVDRATLTSLNIPAERRTAQIAVSLQRWRETTIGADFERRHIRTSLPDFHAELWEGDERLMRFRTVIGANRRARNPRTGQMELITATPTFFRSLRYVVFNPTWNIPPGIRARDYDPRIAENPNFFEEEGYQLITTPDGHEFIRQPPGPTNPLGRVKFLFPNEHHVYMHDTPARHLFSHPLRAYSSGCVRVEGAMDFAHLLLRLDRGWNDRRIEDFIASQFDDPDNERWVTLLSPIPVHIEYYVVRYDDSGDTHFLADIYRWDLPLVEAMEERLFGDPPATTPEEAEPVPVSLISGP